IMLISVSYAEPDPPPAPLFRRAGPPPPFRPRRRGLVDLAARAIDADPRPRGLPGHAAGRTRPPLAAPDRLRRGFPDPRPRHPAPGGRVGRPCPRRAVGTGRAAADRRHPHRRALSAAPADRPDDRALPGAGTD